MSTDLRRWRFFRVGGFDQVRIDTSAELLATVFWFTRTPGQ